jgi:hypothetical protein
VLRVVKTRVKSFMKSTKGFQNGATTLSITNILKMLHSAWGTECWYAECHNAECKGVFRLAIDQFIKSLIIRIIFYSLAGKTPPGRPIADESVASDENCYRIARRKAQRNRFRLGRSCHRFVRRKGKLAPNE